METSRRVKAAQAALFGAMEPVGRLFMPQDVIIAPGERPNAIYRVQSGLIAERRILGDGRAHIRGFLLPGDCFGALWPTATAKSSHSAEALAPTTIAVLTQYQLTKLKTDYADIEFAQVWTFADLQSRRRDWETILACGTAFEKIAAMLYDLCERTQRWQNSFGGPVRLPIGQREIAEHLGLTLPHVSRTLRQLRDAQLIASHYRSIEIRDPAALAKYISIIVGTGE